MVGEDVAAVADDDAGAEAGSALRFVRELFSEEPPEERVVEERVALRADLFGSEDIHH